ncbi:MAG: MFS transporter [Burkholderiaceae bacterium]|nr:MAG: MFS transporter [Burkholderiaceae bacterium]TAM02871.1 MAG: MFS transporter [Pusillimonas sp.]
MADVSASFVNDLKNSRRREHLVWLLAAIAFLIFFQGYMIAPLIPRLATVFGVSVQTMGLAVPAYLIAYGVGTLFYGPVSDRRGRRPVIVATLVLFIVLTALTSLASSSTQLTLLRLATGLGAGGIVPLGVMIVGDLFPYAERGRPIGWLFGAMAGGMAGGSVAGVLLEPLVSWQGLFFGVAAVTIVAFVGLLQYVSLLGNRRSAIRKPLGEIVVGYWSLLGTVRGRRTYGYVFLNALFHSGVFTWLGVYFSRRYGVGEIGIGLALLGYGIPGFLFGPAIGRLADRLGRSRLIPAGLILAGISAAALTLPIHIAMAPVLVTLLSLGYDLTQPLLAGIVTDLGPQRGQAVGLMAFILFVGFGVGSLVFGAMLPLGIEVDLVIFGCAAVLLGLLALVLFRGETRR